jgi:hypothetical protein
MPEVKDMKELRLFSIDTAMVFFAFFRGSSLLI